MGANPASAGPLCWGLIYLLLPNLQRWNIILTNGPADSMLVMIMAATLMLPRRAWALALYLLAAWGTWRGKGRRGEAWLLWGFLAAAAVVAALTWVTSDGRFLTRPLCCLVFLAGMGLERLLPSGNVPLLRAKDRPPRRVVWAWSACCPAGMCPCSGQKIGRRAVWCAAA